MTWPVPPATPMVCRIERMRSLAVVPSGGLPFTRTCIDFERRWTIVCVARTCSTSEMPIPKASAPNAPCVDVWLSPHTRSIPGKTKTELRPDHVDDALAPVADRIDVDPCLLAVRLDVVNHTSGVNRPRSRCRFRAATSAPHDRRRRLSGPGGVPCDRQL